MFPWWIPWQKRSPWHFFLMTLVLLLTPTMISLTLLDNRRTMDGVWRNPRPNIRSRDLASLETGVSEARSKRPPLGTPELGSQEVLGPGMGGSAIHIDGEAPSQKFATQPAPQTAVVGSRVVLPCRVIGKVGTLQWTKDGFGLGTSRDLGGYSRYSMIGSDDEGDYSLSISPVLLLDDAIYQCQVSASDGVPGIRSRAVRLTVYVPPEPPRVRPTVLNTTVGMTVELECESRGGRPSPEIQWVDEGKREAIQLGSSVSTNTMADGKRMRVVSRLRFTPRRHHHNRTLACVTSNQALTSPLTTSVLMYVAFPPEVRLSYKPTTLMEGDDVTFICEAEANPDVITFKWYHSNQQIANETLKMLTLRKISRTLHQDVVACEVSNRVGTSRKNIGINVQYGPVFNSLPRDTAAEIGKEVTLKCSVSANPPASISWLQEGSHKIIGSGEELSVAVREDTAGPYKCVARVRGFPELQGTVRVLIKGPPQILSSSEQEGRMGDTVNLECNTVSIPSPIQITWTYQGKEIDLSDPRYEVVEDEIGNSGKVRNILVIHDADAQDFGSYNCSVVNEYGIARKQIHLNKEKRIPVLLLVGSGLALTLVLVVVTSLLLCNKRHSSVKDFLRRRTVRISRGSAVPDKQASSSGPPHANMYCGPPDTKLTNNPTPSPGRSLDSLSLSMAGGKSVSGIGLQGDEMGRTFVPREDAEGSSNCGYVPFVDYQGKEYFASISNGGRRSSLTDSSPLSLTAPRNVSVATTDFCTIRRGARSYDLGDSRLHGTQMPPRVSLPTNCVNGLGLSPGARPPLNGSSPGINRPYADSLRSNFTSPPPPPYPRVSSRRSSPHDIISPSRILAEEPGSPDTQYIFSPEAILKPGTLV